MRWSGGTSVRSISDDAAAHPLKWKAPAKKSEEATAVAAAADEMFLKPVKSAAREAIADEAELLLNPPQTGDSSFAAPPVFVPARAAALEPVPARSSGKHLAGWNKVKIDTEVKQASHPAEVDAFADPFQDRIAQAAPRVALQQPQPRSGGGFQPAPQLPADGDEADPGRRGVFDRIRQRSGFQPDEQPGPSLTPPVDETPTPPVRRPRLGDPAAPPVEPSIQPPPETPLEPTQPPRIGPRQPGGTQRAPMADPDTQPQTPDFQRDPQIMPSGPMVEPQVGPAVEDPKVPGAKCDRTYNERDCCEADEQCRRARQFIRDASIRKISLDITPRFKPDASSWDEDNSSRDERLKLSDSRTWYDREGQLLATGRLVDLAQGRAIVREANGTIRRLPMGNLNEDEICFINAWWSLPTECVAGYRRYEERNWVPSTFTWTASALCHKTLYFEDVQLERYGHSAGPIFQPVLSGAHFFINIVALPYNMGISPPQECHYVLGYYRPGSCAPWMIPPVPLSVRGALAEAGVVVGGIYLIP